VQPPERALHLASRATELDVRRAGDEKGRAGAVMRRPITETQKWAFCKHFFRVKMAA
jgi:hypothetical protein